MNQAGFPSEVFEETCRILSTEGFDGIEPNYTEEGEISHQDGRAAMRDVILDSELTVPAVSTTLQWEYPLSSTDDELRNRGIEIGKEMIDVAAEFGADDVLIVPAYLLPGDDYDTAYNLAVHGVRELANYGADRDIGLAIENVQNNFCYSPNELASFVEDVASSGSVSVYFDVGNGYRWGLPERWIRVLGEYISKVHVKDWDTNAHQPTYLLQGDIDWSSVTNALADIDYDGWITAEIPPYELYPERMPGQVIENMKFLFEDLEN